MIKQISSIIVKNYFKDISKNIDKLTTFNEQIAEIAEKIYITINSGNKIIFCGNGGSAADCQHLASEFVGRFISNRNALPAIALTTDTSALTSIGNDFGFDQIFSRQLEAIGQKGDILIAISTSGNSENILKAIKISKQIGIVSIGFTGETGGLMKNKCDMLFAAPSLKTNHIQEMHIIAGHAICTIIDSLILES